MDSEKKQRILDLTFAIQEHAFQKEMDLFGITSVEALGDYPKGRRAEDLLPGAKAVVAVGMAIPDPLMRLWFNPPGKSLFKAQQAVLAYLDLWKLHLATFLEDRGYRAAIQPYRFIPSVRLHHVFQQAGLGYIGKSHLLITPQYGPRVHLGAIVTDAPLIPGKPYIGDDCGSCKTCQIYCPSGAINNGMFDARKCEAYINQKQNQIVLSTYAYLDCDMCLRICPKGTTKWLRQPGKWPDFIDRANQEKLPFTKKPS